MNQPSRRDFLKASGSAAAGAMIPAAAFADPPDKLRANAVVLFQGDSVTDVGRSRSGSEANRSAALGDGYPFLVSAGVLRARPELKLAFYNRGVSGNRVPDLQARWQADTIDLKPDVISILIGVNDFWHTLTRSYRGTAATYESGYTALLEQTRQYLPGVRIVVMEPFVLKTGVVDGKWFPGFDERREAAARVAKRVDATFVPLQSMFDKLAKATAPEYWAADGVHPTLAGHAAIAEQWRKVLRF